MLEYCVNTCRNDGARAQVASGARWLRCIVTFCSLTKTWQSREHLSCLLLSDGEKKCQGSFTFILQHRRRQFLSFPALEEKNQRETFNVVGCRNHFGSLSFSRGKSWLSRQLASEHDCCTGQFYDTSLLEEQVFSSIASLRTGFTFRTMSVFIYNFFYCVLVRRQIAGENHLVYCVCSLTK